MLLRYEDVTDIHEDVSMLGQHDDVSDREEEVHPWELGKKKICSTSPITPHMLHSCGGVKVVMRGPRTLLRVGVENDVVEAIVVVGKKGNEGRISNEKTTYLSASLLLPRSGHGPPYRGRDFEL